jgi:hypothetical protein
MSAALENRRLTVDLCETILQWERRRRAADAMEVRTRASGSHRLGQ